MSPGDLIGFNRCPKCGCHSIVGEICGRCKVPSLSEYQTPRTDAVARLFMAGDAAFSYVDSGFARSLERENIALREWIKLRNLLDLLDEFDDPHNFQGTKKELDSLTQLLSL